MVGVGACQVNKKEKKNKKKKKKGCIHPKIGYTYPIMTETTTKKTDQEKFFQERNAATEMRDDLCWLVGWTRADNPEISKRLEDILKNHDRNRVDWF
tara:strand:+ start:182 stop:472 length:291 start_codon:yes stop_codon:yes gene_type:complete